MFMTFFGGTSCLLDKSSTTWATLPALLAFYVLFFRQGSPTFPELASNLQSFFLRLRNSWDDKCAPPHVVLWESLKEVQTVLNNLKKKWDPWCGLREDVEKRHKQAYTS
jgi:hypothetical protein